MLFGNPQAEVDWISWSCFILCTILIFFNIVSFIVFLSSSWPLFILAKSLKNLVCQSIFRKRHISFWIEFSIYNKIVCLKCSSFLITSIEIHLCWKTEKNYKVFSSYTVIFLLFVSLFERSPAKWKDSSSPIQIGLLSSR